MSSLYSQNLYRFQPDSFVPAMGINKFNCCDFLIHMSNRLITLILAHMSNRLITLILAESDNVSVKQKLFGSLITQFMTDQDEV